jgi:hypothetical protein
LIWRKKIKSNNSFNLGDEIINNKRLLGTDAMVGNIEPSLNSIKSKGLYSFKDTIFSKRVPSIYRLELLELLDFSINNYGHRSSDFLSLDNSKTNILFAGCSMTFGESLPEKYSWPHYIINKIKQKDSSVGSTDILSYPGGSTDKIIKNVFRYIDKIGKPDYIFILLPDFFRDVTYDNESANYKIKMMYDLKNNKKFDGLEYVSVYDMFTQYKTNYEILEIFCRSLGIKLFAGSWYTPAGKAMKKIFTDFVEFSNEDVLKYFKSKSFDQEYYNGLDHRFDFDSADDAHPGTMFHMMVGDTFLKLMQNDI